tara:strand:+ start:233 stop:439 length:207 start_codon:yes stop_codon:yes gene_type:complete
MDYEQIIKLLKSMEDGALEPQEAQELIDLMTRVIDRLLPMIKKKWTRLIIYGVRGTLVELREHIGEME